jgi:hypothetical protein
MPGALKYAFNTAQGDGVSWPGLAKSDLGATCGAEMGPTRFIALTNAVPTSGRAVASEIGPEAPGRADKVTGSAIWNRSPGPSNGPSNGVAAGSNLMSLSWLC